jgi:hypothetical protein
MSGPISSFFQSDHTRLDGLLCAATRTPGELDPQAYAAFRAGLLKHIALEEKLLLPAARRLRGGEPLELARRLRVEHGALAALLVPSPTLELVSEIRSILEPHNRLEEEPGGVYDICDELLAGEAEALLAKARSYPEVRVAPYYDGAGVCRTAEEALRISEKQSAPRHRPAPSAGQGTP